MSALDPFALVAAGLALWLLLLTIALVVVVRHIVKVDDFSHEMDEDLTTVENKVERLVRAAPTAPTTVSMPAIRLYPEPSLGAPSAGRHARPD